MASNATALVNPKVKGSFTLEVQCIVDGAPTKHGYVPQIPPAYNVLANDVSKGLATVQVTDNTGAIVSDANGVSLTNITMFAHPTDQTKFVYPVIPGLSVDGRYTACMWYRIPLAGTTEREPVFQVFTIDPNPNKAPTPAAP